MKTITAIRILPVILLVIAAGLTMMMLIYALQDPQVVMKFATVSWNGEIPL